MKIRKCLMLARKWQHMGRQQADSAFTIGRKFRPTGAGVRRLRMRTARIRSDIGWHREALVAVRSLAVSDTTLWGFPAGPAGLYVAARCRETPLVAGPHKDPGGRRRMAKAIAKAQAARDERGALEARLAMSHRQTSRAGVLFRAFRAKVGHGLLAV